MRSLLWLIFPLFFGCHAFMAWDQYPTTPTADNPCGQGWVQCASHSTCCPTGHTCGGDPGAVGCPAGACCYIGTDADSRAERNRIVQRHVIP
jgi:hypothetical protein